MNIRDIEAAHQADERITDDPYLPGDKAIARFQRAHYHRGQLLERLEQSERERDEARARVEKLEQSIEVLHEMQRAVR